MHIHFQELFAGLSAYNKYFDDPHDESFCNIDPKLTRLIYLHPHMYNVQVHTYNTLRHRIIPFAKLKS